MSNIYDGERAFCTEVIDYFFLVALIVALLGVFGLPLAFGIFMGIHPTSHAMQAFQSSILTHVYLPSTRYEDTRINAPRPSHSSFLHA